MDKTLNPVVESFEKEEYSTDFNKHLQKIYLLENHNTKINEINQKRNINHLKNSKKFINDHRLFFKSILGEPKREYPGKKYVIQMSIQKTCR